MKSLSRILFIVLALALGAFPLAACSSLRDIMPGVVSGSGEIAAETRTFTGISGVALATSGDLTVELGAEQTLLIETDDNLLPLIETRIHDGVLTIDSRLGKVLKPSRAIRYVLTVPSLESAAVLSHGSITTPALEADHFLAEVKSTGAITIAALSAATLEATIVSVGDVRIGGGDVTRQQVTIVSTGSYLAGDVRSQSAGILIASSGSATVWVTDRLDVDIKSSGDVSYYGSPEVSVETTSSGKVVALGDR